MTNEDPTTTRATHVPESDAFAQLIRAAGRRPSPSAHEYERVRLAAHLAWQMKVQVGRRRRVLWLALAASVAAVAVGVVMAPRFVPPRAVAEVNVLRGVVERFSTDTQRWEPLTADAALAAGTRLRTVADSGAAFAVAGGISVRVGEATHWVFADATRFTLEAGTLYVDTGRARQNSGSVEIVTAHGTVHDVGTQFEVRALSSELRLRVREGRVQVVAAGEPALYETPAGEELRLAVDGAVARLPIASDSAEWRWAEALAAPIELDGGSAFEALQWVARETGKRLVFADANAELLARNAIIHGSSTDLEPLQILEVVMATSAGLEYSLGDGILVIRRR